MKKITWISLILFILVWYFFGKYWQNNPNNNFKFSDRDKIMVFPTPKTSTLDPEAQEATKATNISLPTPGIQSSTESSVIKF